MKPVIRHEKDVEFNKNGPFPAKYLLSKQDMASASVKVGTLDKGNRIELHAHSECDQLEYYLKGQALMFIEGLGQQEVREGTFTYVPKGAKHGVLDVRKPLTILTVFVPPLF